MNPDDVIEFMNELVRMDRRAVTLLCNHRVICNSELMNHPTVQVSQDSRVGLIGVLNGLCSQVYGLIEGGKFDGYGYIAAVYGDDGLIERFQRTDVESIP